ncbi:cation:proton antiporter regulatory subunit [Alkalibacillus almallahensis]|uniref:cation:proton antiporter regulatory subunit n=1 Tax=Alkalibacillus almallahensis TaxID=1379154 RepID=UPI001424182D|nr:TrkA C-terminal domain-containing protein [Alkalibacillus almallahensis]NIK13043.1 TrkA domain protein [Alkalibacillus almallahensis]
MQFHETELPGVGKKITFKNSEGIYTVMILHHSGKREFYYLEDDDDDEPLFSTTLTSEETKELAIKLLGSREETPEDDAYDQMSLVRKKALVNWVDIKQGSCMIERSVGSAQNLSENEVSIVAIFREDELLSKPADDVVIHEGDTLMVLGRKKAVEEFEKTCKE